MIKNSIKSLIQLCGYDLHKLTASASGEKQITDFLKYSNTDLVIDVGANTGQFVSKIRRLGYKRKVISFEPLSFAHAKLTRKAARDLNWIVAGRRAVGDTCGVCTINVSGNSVSSSILEMEDSHVELENKSVYVGSEPCYMDTLDGFFLERGEQQLSERTFLKIDTQGYEANVILGAELCMKNVIGLTLEVSLVELYKDQPLWVDIHAMMETRDYGVWGISNGVTHPSSGRSCQLEVMYVRNCYLDN